MICSLVWADRASCLYMLATAEVRLAEECGLPSQDTDFRWFFFVLFFTPRNSSLGQRERRTKGTVDGGRA